MRLIVTQTDTRARIVLAIGGSGSSSDAALNLEAAAREAGDLANAAAATAAAALAAAAMPNSQAALLALLEPLIGVGASNVAAGNDTRFTDRVVVTTQSDTPTLLDGLRGVPAGSGVMRSTGHVEARNLTTGDCIGWDVSVMLKLVADTPSLVGSPYVSVFAADPAMGACVLSAAAGAAGITLTCQGLADTPISWAGTFITSVG